ncbi:DUF4180 domain-containing protein [Anaerocolumna sedimenticola]|uniref:DUF4180 domain-containing protein n=1 Tax=Anaerocolumna sedimenticola TaxID=2696063 RepID=A0A6P1TSB7_9FIRM|nr:DUF4180 domain-containing protein [Anaerocolumna sedimenticola]QHQ63247.1 DUF4180 domain-containing protein [Anaerocolumna sedimenticola]
MSIDYAILGILSQRSMTGYDIKKFMQESAFMYWSGNNNQIYKSLVELLDKGLVTYLVEHQDNSPSKKIYTITGEGLTALKEWVLSPSEPGEFKKPFLVQFAWSWQLNSSELDKILKSYETQINMQLLMQQNSKQDTYLSPDRTELTTAIWNMINENIKRTYENELVWIQDVRNTLAGIPNDNDVLEPTTIKAGGKKETSSGTFRYSFINKNEISYIHIDDPQFKLCTERNILDIITVCAENNTQFVLFNPGILSQDFLDLKTGLAAAMLQKFMLYHIKSAIICEDTQNVKDNLRNILSESGRNETFRLFSNKTDAEKWIYDLVH